jgi:hypothetical protein
MERVAGNLGGGRNAPEIVLCHGALLAFCRT